MICFGGGGFSLPYISGGKGMKNYKKQPVFILGMAVLLTLTGCRFFGGKDKSDKILLSIGFWPQKSDKTDVAMYEEWKSAFEQANPEYEIVDDPYTYSKETIGAKFNTHTLPMVYQTWFLISAIISTPLSS